MSPAATRTDSILGGRESPRAAPAPLWARISATRRSKKMFSNIMLGNPLLLSRGLSEGLLVTQQDVDGSTIVLPRPDLGPAEEQTLLDICPEIGASLRDDTDLEGGVGAADSWGYQHTSSLNATKISSSSRRSGRHRPRGDTGAEDTFVFLEEEGLLHDRSFSPSQYVQARPRISAYSSYEADPSSPLHVLQRRRERGRARGPEWVQVKHDGSTLAGGIRALGFAFAQQDDDDPPVVVVRCEHRTTTCSPSTRRKARRLIIMHCTSTHG